MQDKDTLNKLDGDATLQEIMKEKTEKQRGRYKAAVKNAVVRNDNAMESLKRTTKRADKTQTRLNNLVDGGLETFLADEEGVDDDDIEESCVVEETDVETVARRKRTAMRPFRYPSTSKKF